MIGRLFIWLIVYFAPVAVAGYVAAKVVRPRVRLYLEQRRRQRLGARNAKRLEYATHELCLVCQKRTNPEVDIFDERNEKWLHEKCHRELLGSDIDSLENVIALHPTKKER